MKLRFYDFHSSTNENRYETIVAANEFSSSAFDRGDNSERDRDKSGI